MDWGDLAKQVIGLGAPILGAALGGPLGGAAGRILADVVGADGATPDAIGKALPSCSSDRIAQAEATFMAAVKAEADAQGLAVAETQKTMRAELKDGDLLQRLWRPFYALELTVECAALCTVLVHELWTGDLKTVDAMAGSATLLVTYWGLRFGVLGVYFSGRTREKVCQATGRDAPGLVDRMLKAVVTKR
jgi:hypothetical protein